MRLMHDSTTPWDIPRDAKLVAYYNDGKYAWPSHWFDLFPEAEFVSISAIGVRTAQVGDVEAGCIWPPENAVPWTLRARADGFDPTIYVNELNDWLSVRRAFWAAGVDEPHYWVARYNGVREIPPGAVGRQFAHPHDGDGVADRPWETGAHYDLSVMADNWPPGTPHAPGGGGTSDRDEEDMILANVVLPASAEPKMVQVQLPVVGMSEELPPGEQTWAQVAIACPHEDAQIWGLYAITTPGVAKGRGDAVLLAGPGVGPSGETGPQVESAPLGFDLYVPYGLRKGTFAVTVFYSSAQGLSVLITGGKTRTMPALDAK